MHSQAVILGSDPAPLLRIDRHPSPFSDVPLDALLAVARRDNPKRALLLVNKVLGKHLNVAPTMAVAAGAALGELVAASIAAECEQRAIPSFQAALRSGRAPTEPVEASRAGPDAVVISFAETATAIGHLVRRALGPGPMVHTTRAINGEGALLAFSEEHSHAVQHRLFHDDPRVLDQSVPVVLVDDELTTGRTAMNTIVAIQGVAPRRRYIIAVYVDFRGEVDREALAEFATLHDLEIEVVSLVSGTASVVVPDETPSSPVSVAEPVAGSGGTTSVIELIMGARPTARRGWTVAEQHLVEPAAKRAASLLEVRRSGSTALVLGTEELMFIPILVGSHLSGSVFVRSTTRSPILVSSQPGYPIVDGVQYLATDGTSGPRYLYNLRQDEVDDVFLFCEDVEAYRRSDLVGALTARHTRVHIVNVAA